MPSRNRLRAQPDPLLHRAAWHATYTETALEPELPIIDPHHHVWDRDSRYVLEELLDDLDSGHGIRQTVFVQCNSMIRPDAPKLERPIGETEFVNGIAAVGASGVYGPIRVCAGIVGFADLTAGAAIAAVLERHLRAAGDRFKGVRYITAWDDDPAVQKVIRHPVPRHIMHDPKFREGFAQLGKLGLSFDAWLYFHQLGDMARLADAFPEIPIVVNHMGGVLGIGRYAGVREQVFEQWKAHITQLAQRPNTYIKLGGLGMVSCGFGLNEQPQPPTSMQLADTWRPYIETAIEAFGPHRAMFESNFPVDKETCSYAVLWNAFKRLARHASADEKRALFHDTAARVYRLS